jgi:hypothetical protein
MPPPRKSSRLRVVHVELVVVKDDTANGEQGTIRRIVLTGLIYGFRNERAVSPDRIETPKESMFS